MDSTRSGSTKVSSMTGFGRGQAENEAGRVEVELRAVNSRFLDLVLRLPRSYGVFEGRIRDFLGENIARGRVELSIRREALSSQGCRAAFNPALFGAYWSAAEPQLQEHLAWGRDAELVLLAELLSRREILDQDEDLPDEAAEWQLMQAALTTALAELREMREREGGKIGQALLTLMEDLRSLHLRLTALAEDAPALLREKLLERISKAATGLELDNSRLEAEAALLADRADVSEELTRLESHLRQFEQTLQSTPAGRKLEFIIQELGREVNTIGSKVQAAAGQRLVIEAKSLLEKMKEQTLNVE